MIHCCIFLVTHMMVIKMLYDVMSNDKIDLNGDGWCL